jgi:excinuclease ABC subunit C
MLDTVWRENAQGPDESSRIWHDGPMIPALVKIKNGELPDHPGVYLMKNEAGEIIYVGKATSLKRRVSSYFQRPHDARIEAMVKEIRTIDYIEKPTALEALILEANLIKFHWPPYNIREKDNKSFLYLVLTNDDFPKPAFVRGSDLDETPGAYKAVFGPYTSGRSLRAALDLVRKAIPWSTCTPGQKRPCFYFHLKQCPGVCIGAVTKEAYAKIVRDLIKFFEGKKEDLLKQYRKDMEKAAKEQRFEAAAELRNRLFALEHIQDVAIMKREDDDYETQGRPKLAVDVFGRIEGYDISNTGGTSSVASMAVFENGAPAKAEYRKFRIKTVQGANDVASVQETLRRRFRNAWRRPALLLIDGGLPQVNAAEEVVRGELKLNIPLIGIAKGPDRDRNDIITHETDPEKLKVYQQYLPLLVRVRDEAHRFAITYHRKLRGKQTLIARAKGE